MDLEEWFHICGVQTPYSDPQSLGRRTFVRGQGHRYADASAGRVRRTRDLSHRRLGRRALPRDLIRRLVDAGHEIGCHSYYHRLIFELTPDEFREDMTRCMKLLREVSGQPVTTFRAPGFSMKRQCFWAYPILRELGVEIDVSIVPASRDHGGISGFTRDPFLLHTDA